MIMSRQATQRATSRARATSGTGGANSAPKLPSAEEFMSKRDFTGARAVLEFERAALEAEADNEKRTENLM